MARIWVQNFTEVPDRKIKATVVFSWVLPIITSVTHRTAVYSGTAVWVSFSSVE